MPKYHINKHGEPARCDAQIKCRVNGGDTEHFDGTLRDAVDWAEKKNAQSAGGSFGSSNRKSYAKKIPKEPDYDSLYNVNIDSLKRSAKGRRDLISNYPDADGDKFDNPDVFSDLIYGSIDTSGGYNLDNDDYEAIEQQANAEYELSKENGLSNRDAMKSAVTFAVQEGHKVNEAKARRPRKKPDATLDYSASHNVDPKAKAAAESYMKRFETSVGDFSFDNIDDFSDHAMEVTDALEEEEFNDYDYGEIVDVSRDEYERQRAAGVDKRKAMNQAMVAAAQKAYEINKDKEQKNEKSQEFKNIDHSNPDTLRKVLASRFNNPDSPTRKLGHEEHFSRNAGKLNPNDFTGSGSDYTKQGENSLVILADENGKGVRAISSHSDFYEDPDSELGRSALQIKQYGMNTADKKKLLVVVGYVGKDGEKTGYVPNKQVQMFVYK